MNWFERTFLPNDRIGIDAGSYSTKVSIGGKGVVLETRDILLDYSNPAAASAALKALLPALPGYSRWTLLAPRIAVPIRTGAGHEDEMESLQKSLETTGRQVFMIHEAFLALIGAGAWKESIDSGAVALDFGFKQTRIYAVSRNAVVFERLLDPLAADGAQPEQLGRALADLPAGLRGARRFAVGGAVSRPGVLDSVREAIGPVECPREPQLAVARGLEMFFQELSTARIVD